MNSDSQQVTRELLRSDSLRRSFRESGLQKQKESNPIEMKLNTTLIGSEISPVKRALKVVPLKSKTDVLLNFGRSDRIRILEAAENALRSNKSTLDYSIENFDQEQEQIYKHEIEWHRKFTLSFACIVLFLIGAPLGAIVRKGGLGLPVVFSLVFFIIYHMISITGEKLAREGVTSPFWGMWLSSAVLLPVGLFLTWKSTRDSALFDREAYLKAFLFVKGIFRKNSRNEADSNLS